MKGITAMEDPAKNRPAPNLLAPPDGELVRDYWKLIEFAQKYPDAMQSVFGDAKEQELIRARDEAADRFDALPLADKIAIAKRHGWTIGELLEELESVLDHWEK